MYKNYPLKQPRLLLSMLTMALLGSINAFAAVVVPDAGQFSQELKKQPNLNNPGAVELLSIPAPSAEQPEAVSDIRITVNAFKISGNTLFSPIELEALVADLVGSAHNFTEINAGVARITNWYRQRGYLVARAYLPAQDLKDGIVEIDVLEGLLGEQHLNNTSRISDARVQQYLDPIEIGSPLQTKQVDRAVLLLNDTPGVGGARASLHPGESVGTSDLVVELDPGQAYVANVELDNYGSHYTGENRIGGAVALNSPLKLGDQLTFRALTSNADMSYGRISYQLPIGGNGLKLGAAYSDMTYKLGKQYAQNNFHGTASSSSVFASYPFIRSQATNVYGTVTLEQKDLTDIQASTIDKKVRLVNFGLSGSRQDGLGGGGMSTFEGSLVTGKLSMDAESLSIDAASANTNGTFSKLNLNLSRLQHITDNNTLSIAVSGQQASQNLNSSEKFYLGGSNGVRAYPQGEAGGDEGWMVNAELRHNLTDTMQAVAFFDSGSVHVNHTAYLVNTSNTRSISGAGLGLNAQYKALQFKGALAWRVSGGPALSEPITEDKNPRLWLQVSGAF